jgi:predicted amidophosphoribosyltransferase
MAQFVRRKILGKWREGFSLDLHTLSSIFVGYDEFGHPRFDTQRSEIGELLYRLKNKADQTSVPEIVEAVEALMKAWNPTVDILVPVPPSTQRAVQPVHVLVRAISRQLGILLADCVTKTRDIPQLKNVFDLDERAKLLEGLHAVDTSVTQGKRVLLFDDLYRSGATMNAITTELYEAGKATDVFALTITRTRSNQ